MVVMSKLAAAVLLVVAPASGFSIAPTPMNARVAAAVASPNVFMQIDIERKTGDNVEQIKDTKRDKVMTFSYDMSLDPAYEKPVYKGTGNGLGGCPV